jgi:excisionase family DNA binding protein
MSQSERALENQREQREAKLAQSQTGQFSDNRGPLINRTGPWTVQAYADYWGVHRLTVNNWIKSGKLGSVKVGMTRRILPRHDAEFKKRFNSEAFA